MRRKDREVTDPNKIEEIILKCHCCRIGFADAGQVYIVPMNFGYVRENGSYTFYFHGAREGRKIDLAGANPSVGFEMDTDYLLHEADQPCGYSARFQSIIGNGVIRLVEDPEEKKAGLREIMRHSTGRADWEFPEKMVNATAVLKLTVETLSCKEHL